MGRRSYGLSWTAIERMISASNRRKKEQERIDLINSQDSDQKELDPTYSIQNIDFNDETRITRIEILQSQQYRTIDRYVTQNYVRYPIYSNWKTRTKTIKKTIKLTNFELENLNKNSDSLIRDFAFDIVVALNNEELYPSWFIHKCFVSEYENTIQTLETEKKEYKKSIDLKIKTTDEIISQRKAEIAAEEKILNINIKKRNKTKNKLCKIEKSKKSILKSLFTCFIYNVLISNSRKQKLLNKHDELNKKIIFSSDLIQQKSLSIKNLKKHKQDLNDDYSNKKAEIEEQRKKEFNIYYKKQKEVKPLPIQLNNNQNFISLKTFCGFEYEKIIGCYIIHNKIKDKYYVGQSKDVIKRLKQHFKGTTPNNIIFAEDYYSASPEQRENLFEVKIIPCITKDQLDRTEKHLIEDYDAFNSGYNGTSGNS